MALTEKNDIKNHYYYHLIDNTIFNNLALTIQHNPFKDEEENGSVYDVLMLLRNKYHHIGTAIFNNEHIFHDFVPSENVLIYLRSIRCLGNNINVKSLFKIFRYVGNEKFKFIEVPHSPKVIYIYKANEKTYIEEI